MESFFFFPRIHGGASHVEGLSCTNCRRLLLLLLLLRSCCHPSESPRRPQSSPEAGSLLVPSTGKWNGRNKWMQALYLKVGAEIERVIGGGRNNRGRLSETRTVSYR